MRLFFHTHYWYEVVIMLIESTHLYGYIYNIYNIFPLDKEQEHEENRRS